MNDVANSSVLQQPSFCAPPHRHMDFAEQDEADCSKEKTCKGILEAMGDGAFALTAAGTIAYHNPAFQKMANAMPDDVVGTSVDRFIPQLRAYLDDASFLQWEGGRHHLALRTAIGTCLPISLKGLVTFGDGPSAWRVILITALTRKQAAQEVLSRAAQDYQRVFDVAVDGLFRMAPDGRSMAINRAMARIFRYASLDEMRSFMDEHALIACFRPNFRHAFMRMLRETGEVRNFVCQARCRNGEAIWINVNARMVSAHDGRSRHIEGCVQHAGDHQCHEAQRALHESQDRLTGLLNRTEWRRRLGALAGAKGSDPFAVAIIDLDHFRLINNYLGSDTGDDVLKIMAKRLLSCLSENDVAGRYDGNQFAILIKNAHDAPLRSLVWRLLHVVNEPIIIKCQKLHVTSSIGVSVCPPGGATVDMLLSRAETALHRAKDLGHNNAQFCTQEVNQDAANHITMEAVLHDALEKSRFVIFYQPQVTTQTGEISGVEALIRLRQGASQLIPPSEFIPLAEQSGMIIPIGQWILRTACAQVKAWQDAGVPAVPVAVNLSARQFTDKGLVAMVRNALSDTGLDPHYLHLEITESAAMQDIHTTIDVLHQLRRMGVKIVIDDFGTGHSSLSYLRQLPIDTIKLDRFFVEDIAFDEDARSIVSSIVALAHTLKLQVIAEGVETAKQLDALRTLQCNEIQGYHFSKPVPAEQCAIQLRLQCFRDQCTAPLKGSGRRASRLASIGSQAGPRDKP